jgi:LysM repeat protein
MAGVLCVSTAAASVVAFSRGSSSHAKHVKKPVALASTSLPEVKMAAVTPAVATVAATQAAPSRYSVVAGDTVWSIAARSYGAGDLWTKIIQANTTIADPNQIFVGESLIIPDASAPTPVADPKPVTNAVKTLAKAPAVATAVATGVVHHTVAAAVTSASLGGVWACIRQHESGGNYATNTGNGYYGAYQFSLSTWQGLGGSGLPSNASPAVQDAMAQKLQARSGWGQWPQTSRMCGV